MNRYFDGILKNVPSTVDEVIIDTSGEWSTKDGKYKSSRLTAQTANSSRSAAKHTETGSSTRPIEIERNGRSRREAPAVIDEEPYEDEVIELQYVTVSTSMMRFPYLS